jgi:hypothetical protein
MRRLVHRYFEAILPNRAKDIMLCTAASDDISVSISSRDHTFSLCLQNPKKKSPPKRALFTPGEC